jgi:hypothetical protein
MIMEFDLTDYSLKISNCLAAWAKKTQDCNGDTGCLENTAKELRECLDKAFPPSEKVEFESDKINYMLSTMFFLSNRLAKSLVGLSEFDSAVREMVKKEKQNADSSGKDKASYENMEKELNEILSKYF